MNSVKTDILSPLRALIVNWFTVVLARQRLLRARRELSDTTKEISELKETEAWLHDHIGTLQQELDSAVSRKCNTLQSIALHEQTSSKPVAPPYDWASHTEVDCPVNPSDMVTVQRKDGKFATGRAMEMVWRPGFSNSVDRYKAYQKVDTLAGSMLDGEHA